MDDQVPGLAPSGKLGGASDAALAERAADGDGLAFEMLARRYANLMRAYASRLLGSRAEAEDVVQESLVAAWSGLDGLDQPAKVKSWMMRIVGRKAVDVIRRRRDMVDVDSMELVAAETPPERRAVESSQWEALREALDRLPETQRRCWLLRETGEHSYEEIAEMLGSTPTVVRGQLARARARLIEEMAGWR